MISSKNLERLRFNKKTQTKKIAIFQSLCKYCKSQ